VIFFVSLKCYQGRTCLKHMAVPTLFYFSKGKEQPRGESINEVSINEVVSEVMSIVNSNQVAYVDNGSRANSLAADHSNVMMEDTSEQAFAQGVMHDDILTSNSECVRQWCL